MCCVLITKKVVFHQRGKRTSTFMKSSPTRCIFPSVFLLSFCWVECWWQNFFLASEIKIIPSFASAGPEVTKTKWEFPDKLRSLISRYVQIVYALNRCVMLGIVDIGSKVTVEKTDALDCWEATSWLDWSDSDRSQFKVRAIDPHPGSYPLLEAVFLPDNVLL